MAAKLNRTPGSVFVSVEAPPQKTAHAAISADWKSIAHEMIAESTPLAAPAAKPITQPAPVSTPAPKPVITNPLGDKLNALRAEVDNLLNPPPRVNTEPVRGYHYENPIKPKIDYDAPLRAYWDRVMQKRSDERMAYLKNRKGVA